MTLPLVPAFHPSETHWSFVSRTAAAHGIGGRMNGFLQYVGVPYAGVLNGDAAALAKFAEAAGIEPASLQRNAVRREGDAWSLRGESLLKSTLRRGRVFVCPACLREDIAASRAEPHVAAWQRLAWVLVPIRTCREHGLALVELVHNRVPELRGDWSKVIEPHLPRLEALFDASAERLASDLERYLLERLYQGDDSPGPQRWIDGLTWHAAAITCEMLGAVKLHGRGVNVLKLNSDDWWAAGQAGFNVAEKGPAAIHAFFDELLSQYGDRGHGKEEGQAILGRFFHWLARGAGAANDCFEPIRRVTFDWISATMPVAAGEEILGFTVERRRWHSIWTAANEFGVHPKRAKKLFRANGLIDDQDAVKLDHHILIEPDRAAAILVPAAEAIPLVQAETYLGAGRVHTALLAKAGLIVSMPGRGSAGLRRHMFRRSELDAFLERLLAGAVPCEVVPNGCGDVPTVAKATGRKAMDVVRLALGDSVWKGRLASISGYMALVLRIDEVREKLRGVEHGGLTALEASKRLRTRENVVVKLIELGAIKAVMLPRPEDGRMMRFVLPEALASFERGFVSLTDLMRQTGRSGDALKAQFEAGGVKPVFTRDQSEAAWYRREVVARVVKSAETCNEAR